MINISNMIKYSLTKPEAILAQMPEVYNKMENIHVDSENLNIYCEFKNLFYDLIIAVKELTELTMGDIYFCETLSKFYRRIQSFVKFIRKQLKNEEISSENIGNMASMTERYLIKTYKMICHFSTQ